jgi:C_GCAxxG_C_C family probable redox protein
MDPIEQSSINFSAGFSCSQSVLRAFAEDLGLEPDMASRVSSAFGGGMARTGRVCGAVSGALMVIGLRFGAISPADQGAKEATYALARKFLEEFMLLHGSVDCPGLLGCDIGKPEGMQQAREQNLFKTQCPDYVRDASGIAARILASSGEG